VEDSGPARLEIGSTLKQTRQRLGLEIREVEERTKIRIKYLRALENEEWDVLPAPAYVRGFLRAYADLLELDGEVLADEYRRQFEEVAPQPAQAVGGVLGERPLEHRGDRRRLSSQRVPLLLAIGAAAAILIVVLAITSGSDDGQGETGEPAIGLPESGESASDEVRLAIVADTDVEVCALDADERPLIDGQLLSAGTRESLGKSTLFSVDLGAGEVRFIVDGDQSRVELDAPATYEISAAGIEALPPSGPGCP
jgi:transcriptional regulator with XRE-family HTH domain